MDVPRPTYLGSINVDRIEGSGRECSYSEREDRQPSASRADLYEKKEDAGTDEVDGQRPLTTEGIYRQQVDGYRCNIREAQ